MSDDINFLLLKGLISELPAERAKVINEAADRLRQVVKEAGENGLIALSLVTAEAVAKVQ